MGGVFYGKLTAGGVPVLLRPGLLLLCGAGGVHPAAAAPGALHQLLQGQLGVRLRVAAQPQRAARRVHPARLALPAGRVTIL